MNIYFWNIFENWFPIVDTPILQGAEAPKDRFSKKDNVEINYITMQLSIQHSFIAVSTYVKNWEHKFDKEDVNNLLSFEHPLPFNVT